MNSIATSLVCLLVFTKEISAFLIDSCGSHYCRHGQCQPDSDGHHSCVCDFGWKGHNCDEGACGHHHCEHGQCLLNSKGHHYCTCDFGWKGSNCADAAFSSDHCGNHHCGDYGVCVHDNNHSDYKCVCAEGWKGTHCNTRVITTTVTTTAASSTAAAIATTVITTAATSTAAAITTTVTTTAATSTAAITTAVPSTVTPHSYNQCQKQAVTNDLVLKIVSSNISASVCAISGQHSSPEAFVLNHCNTTRPSLWKQGQQVMSDCHAIPLFTLIATFNNGIYSSSGGMAGVLIGCLPNGFKVIIQNCGQTPIIEHVEQGGVFTLNPDMYYTVQ